MRSAQWKLEKWSRWSSQPRGMRQLLRSTPVWHFGFASLDVLGLNVAGGLDGCRAIMDIGKTPWRYFWQFLPKFHENSFSLWLEYYIQAMKGLTSQAIIQSPIRCNKYLLSFARSFSIYSITFAVGSSRNPYPPTHNNFFASSAHPWLLLFAVPCAQAGMDNFVYRATRYSNNHCCQHGIMV
jgi:hypothetical protein